MLLIRNLLLRSTAKELITYLKQNKLGRATFLPLNAISGRNTLEKEPCIKENGVIGIASNLVRVSFEYENLARYLLGRILVVDNIDNALLIAKKYKYSLRIVTLEGEQLNPGGSMIAVVHLRIQAIFSWQEKRN